MLNDSLSVGIDEKSILALTGLKIPNELRPIK